MASNHKSKHKNNRAKKEQWKSRGISDNGLKGRNFDNRRLPANNSQSFTFFHFYQYSVCALISIYADIPRYFVFKVFILRKTPPLKPKFHAKKFVIFYMIYLCLFLIYSDIPSIFKLYTQRKVYETF